MLVDIALGGVAGDDWVYSSLQSCLCTAGVPIDFSCTWSHIEILAVASPSATAHWAGVVRAGWQARSSSHRRQRAPAARRRSNTHQASSQHTAAAAASPTTTTTDTATYHQHRPAPPTTPRCCNPPSLVSLVCNLPCPALPATLAPAHVPSTYMYPGSSLACAKSTPTPPAISNRSLQYNSVRTSAKQIACLQTTAQSHCQHPSTSPPVRAGCESRTLAASPVPRPSTPLPAVQPRVIRIHHGGPGSRRRALPDCCPH